MSAAWGTLVGVLTVLIMLSFLAIWLWAWLPHHKPDFETLARLPMNDDARDSHVDEDAAGEDALDEKRINEDRSS